jgi:transposase
MLEELSALRSPAGALLAAPGHLPVTILHAVPPWSNCREHGVRNVSLPWAEPSSRFTATFERLAIDWMKAASQKAVADQLQLNWNGVHAIQQRAAARGLARQEAEIIPYPGIDEKSFTRGHRYFTLVNDLDLPRALYAAEGRTEASLDAFWSGPTPEQIDGVRAIAMDMRDPYINSMLNHLAEAQSKIVFDKFHIAKDLSEAVDLVRRKKNKQLRAASDDWLAGTRCDWLKHPAKMDPADRREFATLKNSALKTARAWVLKESMMAFFAYFYERPARKHYRWWHNWAVRGGLQPMIDKARMNQRRFGNIVTYLKHRITNAPGKSINSKMQWVKHAARGFRSKTNFKTAIYFHCGGLDLTPKTH